MNRVCGVLDPLTPTLSRRERELTALVVNEEIALMTGLPIVKQLSISKLGLNALSLRERARVRGNKKSLMQQLLTGKRRVKVDES
ncbi:MAG: hypothetical protein M0R33_05570 [Methylomonas sp.]|jgi:hypothetical protein|uniref:hypothetical protein n=1 Tax=Methylomonas sp. TaxID=418 RepID=UPI0025E4F343|nr:hypothetical protein [Methylomonas sp.]MCK9605903.1 hypothetical protein [Methylomonas sp.]